jgi:hypothetical protein
MGKDRKKIQQKKAQKAARQRAKKAQHKQHLTVRGPGSSLSLRGALQGPIYECWEPKQLFSRTAGIGPIVVTRKAPPHKILIGVFLIDVFCLGVKDAYIKLLYEEEYRLHIRQMKGHQSLKKISPERARKLVEEAETYARNLGFEPHRDYQAAKKIFGDINPEECSDSFEFGYNGKPLFFAGPYDNKKFRERVIKTLTQSVGPEGFEYIMPLGEDIPPSFLE